MEMEMENYGNGNGNYGKLWLRKLWKIMEKKIMENYGIVELGNCGIMELWNYGIMELWKIMENYDFGN